MASAAYEALSKSIPVTTCIIDTEEEDGEYDCFDIKQCPALLQLVITRLPTVFYVSVVALDQEDQEQVFNLTFLTKKIVQLVVLNWPKPNYIGMTMTERLKMS